MSLRAVMGDYKPGLPRRCNDSFVSIPSKMHTRLYLAPGPQCRQE